MSRLFYDYETSSRADLKKVGVDVYSRHPTTKVLMLAWAVDDGPVDQWFPHQRKMPSALLEMLLDPSIKKSAFNHPFELAITRNTLGIDLDVTQCGCTQVLAHSLGLPGKLETLVRDCLALPKQYWKDPEGDRLMRMFSYPSSKATWQSHPAEFEAYAAYNRQDVIAERKAFTVMSRYVKDIDALYAKWHIDQRINARGLPVDYHFIDCALEMAEISRAEYREILEKMTGLKNPGSSQQLTPWLKARKYPFSSIAKNRASIALKDFKDKIDPIAKEVINIRLESNKTSIKKYASMRDFSVDGRLRNVFQYMGAAATGRWAGRILGQNMPRPWKGVEDDLEYARMLIAQRDIDGVKMFYGKPMEVLASSIRSAIAPKRGKKLVVADLSSIELVVSAWLCNSKFWQDVLDRGLDAYKAFGSRWLDKPYEEITKRERTDSKPAALGCFGGGTEILTERGWIPIIQVRTDDRVFDGVEFVRHDGVVFQGVKAVIDMHGVQVTPDHLILCGEDEWLPAQHVALETQNSSRAIKLANGLCKRLFESRKKAVRAVGITSASAWSAGLSKWFGKAISKKESPVLAAVARVGFALTKAMPSMQKSVSSHATLSASPTASTLCGPGASAGVGPISNTRDVVSNVGSSPQKTSSGTPSPWRGGTIQSFTPIASTTTGTMSPVISASSLVPRISETSKATFGSSTSDSAWSLRIFIANTLLAIGSAALFAESWLKGSHRNKSSMIKPFVEVSTFDVLNAGPRNRFVIRTDAGPMIAHNCFYRLGAGREKGEYPDIELTGLRGYAANMGIELTKEQCKTGVKVFREITPEVVDWWKEAEEAAMQCVMEREPTVARGVRFDLKAPFLRMRLPSGRYIHYCRPRVQTVKMEWEDENGKIQESWVENVTYERTAQQSGKWTRTTTQGGKLLENAVQAIARDILEHGILLAEKAGLNVIGHFHDEILCEVDDDREGALELLIKCMTTPPKWAEGMTLRAAGYESHFYKKD